MFSVVRGSLGGTHITSYHGLSQCKYATAKSVVISTALLPDASLTRDLDQTRSRSSIDDYTTSSRRTTIGTERERVRPSGSRVFFFFFFFLIFLICFSFFDLHCCTICCNLSLEKSIFDPSRRGTLWRPFFFLKKKKFRSVFFSCVSFLFPFSFFFLLAFLFNSFCKVPYIRAGQKVTRVTVGRDIHPSFRVCKVNLATLKVAIKDFSRLCPSPAFPQCVLLSRAVPLRTWTSRGLLLFIFSSNLVVNKFFLSPTSVLRELPRLCAISRSIPRCHLVVGLAPAHQHHAPVTALDVALSLFIIIVVAFTSFFILTTISFCLLFFSSFLWIYSSSFCDLLHSQLFVASLNMIVVRCFCLFHLSSACAHNPSYFLRM